MLPPSDLTIEFRTERFDYRSELPAGDNAGNRLYGREVAEYLCQALEVHGIHGDFLDEDWGWLVLAHENAGPTIEICVYHWDDDDASARNVWRLRVASFIKEAFWVVFRRRRNVANSPRLVSVLRQVLEANDIEIRLFGVSEDW